ncbi:MAG: DUF4286 family protein [Gemmatimonadota bacterium]
MISYEVTANVQDRLVPAWEEYMRKRHVPDLIATGCFVGAIFCRDGEGRYRTQYIAADEAALDRYFAEHAPRLRAHVLEEFPQGIELSRENWLVIERW